MKNPLITTLVAVTLLISICAHAQFLPQVNPYQQMGYPVSGAYPNSNPYNGSGQAMMSNCPYPQSAYDPASAYDKDPLVVSAKEDLKTASDGLMELRKKVADSHHELMMSELKLGKDIRNVSADTLLKEAKACEDMPTPTTRTPEGVRDAIKGVKGLSGSDALAYCFQARYNNFTKDQDGNFQTPTFQIRKMCYPSPLNAYEVAGKPNTDIGPKNDGCEDQIEEAYGLYKTWSDANDELKSAQADQMAAAKEVAAAREEAKKYNDEMVALGLNSSTAGCPDCMAGQAQQQKSVMSNGKFWGALGLIGGISTLSILAQEHQYNNIARMGYIANPNQAGIISSGLSSGMSAGYPFLQSSLYGQTGLNAAQGGYGCGQTMASSQFMQPQGPFMGGSNYFPYGGQYMPGASPMGVSPYGMPGMGMPGMGMPGMGMPGMGMPGMGMPGMGMPGMGMPGMGMPGMGMPGMGMGMPGMYNPYAQQAQYSQYMNQQMVDMMRQQQVAMYAIGYGLNNANQQYSYAQSILGGSYGMGGMGMGMGMMPGLGMGMPGMAYGGSPCGMGSLGGSISICGATGLGGSFAPTNAGYNYGGFAPAGYGATPYNLGTPGLSTGGVVNFR